MNDNQKKGVTIASAAAATVAAYIAYRTFKKQKGALEGLFSGFAKGLKKGKK